MDLIGTDPRAIPSYTPTEAAFVLDIPPPTVRSWLVGRPYRTEAGLQHWPRLVMPDGQDEKYGVLLSFYNLVELHVLRAMRIRGVTIPKIRRAVDWLAEHYPQERPLLRRDLHTFGDGIFLRKLDEILDLSEPAQLTIREALQDHLARIDWDEDGLARRLWPFERGGGVQLEIDPNISFGRLRIRGTRIPVDVLIDRSNAGETIESIAADYGRPREEIEAIVTGFAA